MNECTTIDTPFCLYDADRNKDTKSFKGPGVLVCSIDNMPTQLPIEATDYFGDLLHPYALDIIKNSDAKKPVDEDQWLPEVEGAIITSNGKLTTNYEYINELRELSNKSRHKTESNLEGKKNILVLGAGMVSAPLVEYLNRSKDIHIKVCSQLKEEADRLAVRYSGVESIYMDVEENQETLAQLCQQADCVVSLLPYALHGLVAKYCVESKTHLVTASYVTEEVKSLHEDAKRAGVTLLNECGLDPGIDHLLAMETIHDIQEQGGVVESFVSYW
jgi:alpha-aminoadipic semialdehyde synthase